MVRPRDVVEQWARAFNARDADAAAGLYDENASNCRATWFRQLEIPL
jgi:ketosteroid isomerase-like protein